MKLAISVLLTLTLTVSTAFAASLKTGSYEASYDEMSLNITLNADGSGFFEGETQNRLEWKQTSSELVLKIYGEEGSAEFGTYKATVLSQDSFDLGGLKYIYTAATLIQEIGETDIIGIYKGPHDPAYIYLNEDGDGYCLKVFGNEHCTSDGLDEIGALDFEVPPSGDRSAETLSLEFTRDASGLSFSLSGDPVTGMFRDYGTYTKVSDLYIDLGIEGPKSGIFCGAADEESEFSSVCIKDTPTSKEVWIEGWCGISDGSMTCPNSGVPVEYSVRKASSFNIEAEEFNTTRSLTSFTVKK